MIQALTRVLVVDANPVFRRGLTAILNDYPDFLVAGSIGTAREAAGRETELQPHVIILDATGQGSGGIEAIRELGRRFPDARILAVTALPDRHYVSKAIRAGARGYMLKSVSLNELVDSIRILVRGNSVLCPSNMAGPLLGDSPVGRRGNTAIPLSPREREVLVHLARGSGTKEIAVRCRVSEGAVKAYVRRVLGKLSAKNRAQAVSLAVRKGLLD